MISHAIIPMTDFKTGLRNGKYKEVHMPSSIHSVNIDPVTEVMKKGIVDKLEVLGESGPVPGGEDSEAPEPEKAAPSPLTLEDRADISSFFEVTPPKRKYILEDILPAGITSVLNSPGGVGKSNICNLIGAVVASGVSINPFIVNEARRVLLLNVEDSEADLHRRFHVIGKMYPELKDNLEVLRRNFILFPGLGKIGPLMRLENGNPVMTVYGQWLRESMITTRPSLVILDTKSRLYGLDENNNDHAAQWWAMIERILTEVEDCSVIVAAHSGKANYGNSGQESNRGASAFVDNARVNIVLNHMSDRVAKLLEVNPYDYFEMALPKANYTKRGGVYYFRKEDEGVPIHVNLRAERLSAALSALVDGLEGLPGKKISRRELEQRAGGKDIRKAIKDAAGFNKDEVSRVINYGVDVLALELKEEENTHGSPSVMVFLREVTSRIEKPSSPQLNLFESDTEFSDSK